MAGFSRVFSVPAVFGKKRLVSVAVFPSFDCPMAFSAIWLKMPLNSKIRHGDSDPGQNAASRPVARGNRKPARGAGHPVEPRATPKPGLALANLAICRAGRLKPGGFVHCLVGGAYNCPYVIRQDDDRICGHPKRDEIIIRTAAKLRGSNQIKRPKNGRRKCHND